MAGYYIYTESIVSESNDILLIISFQNKPLFFFQDPDPHSVYYFALSSWDNYEVVWQLPYVQGTICSDQLKVTLSIEH